MISKEVSEMLTEALESGLEISVLDSGESDTITTEIAERFVVDPTKLWWWDSLKLPNGRISYAGFEEFEAGIRSVVIDESALIIMVITDDSPPPWISLRGSLSGFVKLLKMLPNFEFFLCDKEKQFVIFDTHHNALVWSRNICE